MKFASIILKTFVGLIIILIGLWIFVAAVTIPDYTNNSAYSFVDGFVASITLAGSLFALSIICTAGVSLIIWLPLGYLVGAITFAVTRFFLKITGIQTGSKKAADEQPAEQKQPALNRDQMALVNYIQKARKKGLTDTQIAQNLLNNGWTNASITAALTTAQSK